MNKNKKLTYPQMGEHGIEELEAKLWIARNNAESFGPMARPGLVKANEFWTNEVSRLENKVRNIFGI